ncbi:MAG TPA: hypothetical protein VF627_05125 [Abditibacterium sp.]|jgi:hypothetical protein
MRWLSIFLAAGLGGCAYGFSIDERVGSHHRFVAVDSSDQNELLRVQWADSDSYSGQRVLGPTISRAGWDSTWLIMEHRAQDASYRISDKRRYYLFRLRDEKLFGPYKKDQFDRQKVRLGVSRQLDFARQFVND